MLSCTKDHLKCLINIKPIQNNIFNTWLLGQVVKSYIIEHRAESNWFRYKNIIANDASNNSRDKPFEVWKITDRDNMGMLTQLKIGCSGTTAGAKTACVPWPRVRVSECMGVCVALTRLVNTRAGRALAERERVI
jgi:hypothetical protein